MSSFICSLQGLSIRTTTLPFPFPFLYSALSILSVHLLCPFLLFSLYYALSFLSVSLLCPFLPFCSPLGSFPFFQYLYSALSFFLVPLLCPFIPFSSSTLPFPSFPSCPFLCFYLTASFQMLMDTSLYTSNVFRASLLQFRWHFRHPPSYLVRILSDLFRLNAWTVLVAEYALILKIIQSEKRRDSKVFHHEVHYIVALPFVLAIE